MDCSLPDSPVHGIHQARTLGWVAISFSRIFPTQGLNPGLLHCRQILDCLGPREALHVSCYPVKDAEMDLIYVSGKQTHFQILPLLFAQILSVLGAVVVWLSWDPMDCSPPGSSGHGISQARILEWVAVLPVGNYLFLCALDILTFIF